MYAALAHYLAWPIVVLLLGGGALIAFCSEVKGVLRRLTKLKAGSFVEVEAEQFQEVMKTIEAEVSINSGTTKLIESKDLAQETFRDKALRLAQIEPAAAILFSWITLEPELFAAAERASKPDSPRTALQAMDWLIKANLISSETISRLNQLRAIRNILSHQQQGAIAPTYKEAEQYITLTEQMLSILIAIKHSPDRHL